MVYILNFKKKIAICVCNEIHCKRIVLIKAKSYCGFVKKNYEVIKNKRMKMNRASNWQVFRKL